MSRLIPQVPVTENKSLNMMLHLRIAAFMCACMIGMILALIVHWYQKITDIRLIYWSQNLPKDMDIHYVRWLEEQNLNRVVITDPEDYYYTKKRKYNLESEKLFGKIRVLCVIFTTNYKRVKAIKSTWASHCNDHLFISYSNYKFNGTLETIKPVDKNHCKALCYAIHKIHYKYMQRFDWLLVVNDNSFAVVENLRYFVAAYDKDQINYFGHAVKNPRDKLVYNLAESGILLSSGAISYLNDKLPTSCVSNVTNLPYDKAIGTLMREINVYPIDTRDHLGRSKFNAFNLESLVPSFATYESTYWKQSLYLSKEGLECCSNTAITFGNIAHKKMYFTYYLIYRLHTFKEGAGVGNIANGKPLVLPNAEKSLSLRFNAKGYEKKGDKDKIFKGKAKPVKKSNIFDVKKKLNVKSLKKRVKNKDSADKKKSFDPKKKV